MLTFVSIYSVLVAYMCNIYNVWLFSFTDKLDGEEYYECEILHGQMRNTRGMQQAKRDQYHFNQQQNGHFRRTTQQVKQILHYVLFQLTGMSESQPQPGVLKSFFCNINHFYFYEVLIN